MEEEKVGRCESLVSVGARASLSESRPYTGVCVPDSNVKAGCVTLACVDMHVLACSSVLLMNPKMRFSLQHTDPMHSVDAVDVISTVVHFCFTKQTSQEARINSPDQGSTSISLRTSTGPWDGWYRTSEKKNTT